MAKMFLLISLMISTLAQGQVEQESGNKKLKVYDQSDDNKLVSELNIGAITISPNKKIVLDKTYIPSKDGATLAYIKVGPGMPPCELSRETETGKVVLVRGHSWKGNSVDYAEHLIKANLSYDGVVHLKCQDFMDDKIVVLTNKTKAERAELEKKCSAKNGTFIGVDTPDSADWYTCRRKMTLSDLKKIFKDAGIDIEVRGTPTGVKDQGLNSSQLKPAESSQNPKVAH